MDSRRKRLSHTLPNQVQILPDAEMQLQAVYQEKSLFCHVG